MVGVLHGVVVVVVVLHEEGAVEAPHGEGVVVEVLRHMEEEVVEFLPYKKGEEVGEAVEGMAAGGLHG